ncbi:organic cation transporter 1-like [Homarus americanus]|uniref:organic cation transporter 1-like n=1 Tax=Homarus americanus TaxID=6706 RepID=UPI001C45B4FC|nr:organic cation transporter 1-like [Homarus americanus]
MFVPGSLGRHSVFFLTLAIHIVFTLSYCWVSNIGLHLTLRFFQGLSFESNYLMPYTIVLEVVPPDHRAMVIMLCFAAWSFGMCFTALVAWLIPNWQYLALISCLPSLLGFSFWRYLPESPRWLLSKGRLGQCVDILLQMARENGKEETSRTHLEEDLRRLTLTEPEKVPFSQVLAYPKLRFRAILIFFMMYCMHATYGSLLLGINVMPSNYFLSHFILSISELPSNFLGWIITHYLGRRFMCWFTYILLAVFAVAATFCTHDEWLLLIVLAMAKLLATQGLYVIFVLASEIFPTSVRTSGIGLTIVFGTLGMVVCPYVLNSGLGATFQYWVMAGLSLMSLLLSLPVPETIGLPLPQTFQEAENLGAGRPLSAWIHHWNKNEYPTPSPLHLLPDHQQELKEFNPKKPFVQ